MVLCMMLFGHFEIERDLREQIPGVLHITETGIILMDGAFRLEQLKLIVQTLERIEKESVCLN